MNEHSNQQFVECYYCKGVGHGGYGASDGEECPFCDGAGGFWCEIKDDTPKKLIVPEEHSNQRFEKCDYCDGTGVIETWDMRYGAPREEECPFCDGAGGWLHEKNKRHAKNGGK